MISLHQMILPIIPRPGSIIANHGTDRIARNAQSVNLSYDAAILWLFAGGASSALSIARRKVGRPAMRLFLGIIVFPDAAMFFKRVGSANYFKSIKPEGDGGDAAVVSPRAFPNKVVGLPQIPM
ncbi:hypothetical protein [Mesorhizobium sp.]|uniref:hypothetical protein n=1 Tax=Mesorhizobium sp. TaxID=1871066 RepID=UPI00263157FB|nr:hypothetical protein [Mesorhizobium sp.]